MLRDIIRFSLISSVFKRIEIHTSDGIEYRRSQINVLIKAPFGVGKSNLLDRIERAGLGYRMMRWTEKALYGTINTRGEIIPPTVIQAAGSTVLIDEFQAVPEVFKKPLLALMEEQVVDRELLTRVPTPVEFESKYWKVWANEGYMKTWIQASYIVCTSKLFLNIHTERMLASRCIVFHLDVDYEDMLYGTIKVKINDIPEIKAELDEYQGVYTEAEEKKLLEQVIAELRARNIAPNYAYRVKDDILRIMNILSALGEDRDKAWKYLDIILHGIRCTEFTPLELEIYSRLNGRTPISKIKIEGLSDSLKAEILARLIDKGLVREIKRGVYARM